MPFQSAKQEIYMQINHPEIWKEWVKKYGHAKGYKKHIRQVKRKSHGGSKRRKK